MPRLYYSNHLEHLVKYLTQHLAQEQARFPFRPIRLVVRNFNLQKWLSLEIAKHLGIAANLRFDQLEDALRDLLFTASNPDQPAPQMLTSEKLTRLILEVLRQEALEGQDALWEDVRGYLRPQAQLQPDAIEMRLSQLASRLSDLFQEYGYSRYEMLKAWEAGTLSFSGEAAERMELWQQALWLALFGPQGKVTRLNESRRATGQAEWGLLPQLVERFQPQASPTQEPLTLHIFGLSYISQFHQRTLVQLDAQHQIFVYTLNPCMEFWEDLQTDWVSLKAQREALLLPRSQKITPQEKFVGELFANTSENPLLQAWGRPGRENLRLLNEWSNWDFDSNFVDPREASASLLHQVQYDLLVREPRRPESLALPQDESLQILACPNPRREAEIVANEIWELIRRQPHLKFNDIAVILTDMETYQTELELALQRLYQIPYNLIDGRWNAAGRLSEGVMQLFELGFSGYSRKDLFALLTHPNFTQRFGEEIEPESWLRWADELGVFYGIDQAHQESQGLRYFEPDLYNWDQALRRLALGAYLQTSPEGQTPLIRLGTQDYAPAFLESGQVQQAARFALIVQSLIADTRDLPQWEMTASAWGKYLKTLFETYLAPCNPTEEKQFKKLASLLERLQELDQVAGDPARPLKARTILEFVRQQQQKLTLKRGRYLADGVTVCSFLPMRPIPFEAVFVVGLGEGLFPTPLRQDNLDLREARVRLQPVTAGKSFRERKIGDISQAEKDKYMFLETLISARSRLYLTYVNRNERTGDSLEPSSVIQTLLTVLNQQYLAKPFEARQHPLKSYDTHYFPELLGKNQPPPANNYDQRAFAEAQAWQVRQRMEDSLRAQIPGAFTLEREPLLQLYRTWKEPRLPIPPAQPESRAIISLSLAQLRAFLECPLQASAQRKLGLKDEEEEDLRTQIDEPFETESLVENRLLKAVFFRALDSSHEPDWQALYEPLAQVFEQRAELPSGEFKTIARLRHLEQLAAWRENLNHLLGGEATWAEIVQEHKIFRFGRPQVFEKVQEVFPPLRLEIPLQQGGVQVVELQGATQWWLAYQGSWHGVYLTHRPKVNKEKHFLRLFLDGVLLRAVLPEWGGEVCRLGLLPTEAKACEFANLELLTSEAARDYLKGLIRAMLEDDFAFLMPIEAIAQVCKEGLDFDAAEFEQSLREAVQSLVDNPLSQFSSHYGPIRSLSEFAAPPQAFLLFQSRWLDYFRTCQFTSKAK